MSTNPVQSVEESKNVEQKQQRKNPTYQRKVYDSIYGLIYFPQLIWDFIDTPHFQRLRQIKQLGCLEYVFPCATHTRFEHSIGAAHLASKFIEKLIKNNPDEYQEVNQKSAIKTVVLAALLHDIGYGPFCHIFDNLINIEISNSNHRRKAKWNHQLASQLLIDSIAIQLPQHLNEEQIRRIKALIRGNPNPNDARLWQFQLINNKKNGIDVNKLDYYRRDAYYLRAKNIYIDHDLLMTNARILDGQICYPTKYAEDVINIFHSRYKIFKNYHFNVVNIGIELMIFDVLNLIKDKYRFEDACGRISKDAEPFLELTDDILERVEDTYERMRAKGRRSDAEEIQKFKQATQLLQRIKKRDLYRFVTQLKYYIRQNQDDEVKTIYQTYLQKQKIIIDISEEISDIPPIYFSININDVGFGFQEFNPLKKIGFFRKEEISHRKLNEKQAERLSMLRTKSYGERSIKAYVKDYEKNLYLRLDSAMSGLRDLFKRKCEQRLKKETGLYYIFNGAGGKKPKDPKNLNDLKKNEEKEERLDHSSKNEEGKELITTPQTKKRKIYDPVHGWIYFDQEIWSFIDTPEFQRLRKIKQLGCLEYVFSCATHTRFEHSIGTAYLAKKFIESLIATHPRCYEKQDQISVVKTVTLAGLLRDIGHGPFNGLIEREIILTKKVQGYGEEKWGTAASIIISQRLMKEMVENNKVELSKKEIQRVIDLIKGQGSVRKWQSTIINNKKNCIDVDLLQRLRRDSFYLRAKDIYIDHDLLMKEVKIYNDEISYPTKYVQTVYYIFQSRYKLLKNYYNERISKGAEMMICDILKQVKEYFNFQKIYKEITTSHQEFIELTDDILMERVEDTCKRMSKRVKIDQKIKKNFDQAAKLIGRLKLYKYYYFVKEIKFLLRENEEKEDKKYMERLKQKMENEISLQLKDESIKFYVDVSHIGFGLQSDNPMKRVNFFRKEDEGLKEHSKKVAETEIEELSMLYTDAYAEPSVKIFIDQYSDEAYNRMLIAVKKVQEKLDSNAASQGETGGTSKNKYEKREDKAQNVAADKLDFPSNDN